MNESTPNLSRKASPARRIARISLLVLAGLLALCLAVAGGALVWLRTESAAGFLARTASQQLKAQGLELRLERISAILPDLELRGIELADAEGVFFRAAGLTLSTRLSALLTGTLEVAELSLDRPEATRLPKLPPSEEPPAEDAPSSSGITIPFGVKVDRIALRQGRIHATVLHPASPPDAVYSLELSGAAALRGSSLAARLNLDFLHADGSGLTLALDLDAASGLAGLHAEKPGEDSAPAPRSRAGEDSLSLNLRLREGKNGLLALLASDPALPPYSLNLQGKGPVRGWRAELSLLAGKNVGGSGPASEAPDLLAITAILGLQCRSGSLWKDMVEKPAFALDLAASVQGGKDLPASLLPLLGDKLQAEAKLSAEEKGWLAALDASSNAWKASLSNVHIRPAQGENRHPWVDADGKSRDRGLAVDGLLKVSATDIAALMKGAGTAGPPPLRSASLSSSLSILSDNGFTGLSAGGALAAGGVSIPGAGQNSGTGLENFAVDYNLSARLTGSRLNLDTLLLQGLGLSARVTATADTASNALRAQASLQAADHADWQLLAGRLSGFATADNPAPLGGTISLSLSLDLPPVLAEHTGSSTAPQSAPASGVLLLDAENMRWPTPQLAAILGSALMLKAGLSGGVTEGSAHPYTLNLEQLSAGILNAGGKADFLPAGDPGHGLMAGQLNASLHAKITDIAPLTASAPSQPAPASGPLQAAVTARGSLDALRIGIDVSSPALTAAGNALRDLSLKADADTTLTDSAFAAAGNLTVKLGQSPGGPMDLSTRWQAHVPQGNAASSNNMRAGVENFSLRGAGLEVGADLNATLPLAVQGNVKAEVKDWKQLAAITGAPLKGGPASLELRLDHAAGGQEAHLNLRLASLLLKEANAPPSFLIRDVSAELRAIGLPDKLDMDLGLTTGKGMAGPLRWAGGTGSVKGSDNQGDFALSLENQQQARAGTRAAKRQAKGKKSTRPARSTELLALDGSYDLGKMEILLSTLALQQPKSRTGLQLDKPLIVSLDKGVQVKDLAMSFKPGGKLTAEAAFLPGKLDLQARLDSLPFGFFKLFTNATLPDGDLRLEADLSASPSGSKGGFKLQSRISSTQDVTGVARTAESAAPPVFELQLDGGLTPNPGQSAVSGAGVRSMPGIVWLTGNGTLGDSGKTSGNKEGQLSFQIPLRPAANGLPLPEPGAPLAVKLLWNGPIESLWQAVPMPDRYLSGQTRLDLNVGGSMSSPRLLVTAYMAGGRFEDIPNGIQINGISLEAENTPEGNVRALVAAKDNQSGGLAVEANLTGISGQAGQHPQLALRGQLEHFSPIHRDDLVIGLSGIFGLNGPLNALAVTADIVVTSGEFTITRNLGGSVPTLEVVNKKRATQTQATAEEDEETPASGGPVLDVHINMPQYFFIRGMGVNSEWQGDLRISGTASSPSIRGSLKPVRGYVDLLSRSFTISEGEITFTGGMDNPGINLLMLNEGPNITAYIRAVGSAKAPKLELESRPPLPQDEVLAMVLFGKRTSELSRFESIQLANSLRELSGIGGSSLDLMTGARKTLGLDMLRIGGSEGASQRSTSGQSGESNLAPKAAADNSDAGAPTLEAGKYINDSIYVGVEQGATQESTAVRVEVELFPRVTLQGKSTSESSEVGIGWKMDY